MTLSLKNQKNQKISEKTNSKTRTLTTPTPNPTTQVTRLSFSISMALLVDSIDNPITQTENTWPQELNSNASTDREVSQTLLVQAEENHPIVSDKRDCEPLLITPSSTKQKLLSLFLNRPNNSPVDQDSPREDISNYLFKLVPVEEGILSSDDRSPLTQRKLINETTTSRKSSLKDDTNNQTLPEPERSFQSRAVSSDVIRRRGDASAQKSVPKSSQDITAKNEHLLIRGITSPNNNSFRAIGMLSNSSSKINASSARTQESNRSSTMKNLEKITKGKMPTPTNYYAVTRNKKLHQSQTMHYNTSFSIDKSAHSPSQKTIGTTAKKNIQHPDNDLSFYNKNAVRQQEHNLELAAKRINVTTLLVMILAVFFNRLITYLSPLYDINRQ